MPAYCEPLKSKPMDKIEYEILKTLCARSGMHYIEFTTLFLEEGSTKNRAAAAKVKFDKFEKFGLICKQQKYPTPSPTYELTKAGVNLIKGEKYPIGIIDELVEDGWTSVDEELPKVGQPVWVAVKHGSMSPHILLKADILMERGRFSCEMDWVSVVYWKNFDKQ